MHNLHHTCLLIDDNELDNFINRTLLINYHFADIVFINQRPEEALESLRDGTLKPDVIFLDLKMPEMNGFEFLQEYDKIKMDKQQIQVFILSSSYYPADIKRAQNNKYVVNYICKPLTRAIIESLAA